MVPLPWDNGTGSEMVKAESSRACPGSWTISGSVTLNGETCTVNSNIIIQNGGNLTMSNTDITMNLASDDQYHIEVQNGGALHVRQGSNITTSNNNYETYMEAQAGSKLEIRDSEISEFGTLIPNYGIEIYTSDAVIDNSTIAAGFEGIYVEGASPRITNNTIQFMGYHAIETTNSGAIIADNIIKFSDSRGLMIDAGTSAMKIINNNLTWNYEGIHVKIGTTAFIKGNTVNQNNDGGRGIIVDQSDPVIVGNHIKNVNVGIQFLSMSGGVAKNNIIEHGDGNQDVGIKILQQSDPRVDGNTIYDFYRGVTVFGSSDPELNDNTITGNTQYGIYFQGGKGTFRNNTINDTIMDGVNVFLNSDAKFFDNHVFDNDNDGFHIDDSDVVAVNNNVSDNTIAAFHLIGGSTGFIKSNLVFSNGYGIEMEDTATVKMINNDFLDNVGRATSVASGNHLDWFIDEPVNARGNNINLAGNLSMEATGSLTMDNMNLIFHSTASNKWWMDAQGPISMDGSVIKAQTDTLHYSFRAYDSLSVIDGGIRDAGISGTDIDAGVYIDGADATFLNSYITSGYSGLVANGATVSIENGQIDNNDMIGIRASGGSDITVSNSSMSNNVDKDIWLGGNSVVDMRNSSFNKNQVTYTDTGSTLHVSWFIGVKVEWPSTSGPGDPVVGVTVTLKDSEGTLTAEDITNATGWLPGKLVLRELTKSQSTEVLYSPYNITAQVSPTVVGYLDAAVDASKDVTVVMGDLTAPNIAITSPANDAVFNTTWVTVEGTASDAESGIRYVEITSDGGTSWRTAAGNSTWSLVLALAEGTYTIEARAWNLAWGKSTSSITGIFVDTTPPMIIWEGPSNNSLLNTRNVTVLGDSEANAKITVNGVETTANNLGEFSVDIPLAEGPNTITIVAEDRAMNSKTSTRYVTVDSIKPFIDIVGPLTRTASYFQTDINGTTEIGARVTVNGNPVNTNPSTGVFSYSVMLDEGRNAFVFESTDKAGNKNSTTVVIHLDTTEPSLDIIYPTDGAILLNRSVLAKGLTDPWDIGDIPPKAYINDLEAVVDNGGGFELLVPLLEGENLITFRVVDDADNEITSSVRVTVDTTVPTISELNFKDGQKTAKDKILLQGKTEPRSTVTVNGKTITAGATGDFSVEIPLKIGQNAIDISVTDPAGNSATKSFSVERTSGTNGNGGNGNGDDGDDDFASSLPMIIVVIIIIAIIVAAAAFLMRGSGAPAVPPGDRRRGDKDPYAKDRGRDDDLYGDDYSDDQGDDYDDGQYDDHGDDYGDYGDEGYEDDYRREKY